MDQFEEKSVAEALATTRLGKRLIAFAVPRDMLDPADHKAGTQPVEAAVSLATRIVGTFHDRAFEAASVRRAVWSRQDYRRVVDPRWPAMVSRAGDDAPLPLTGLAPCPEADAMRRELSNVTHNNPDALHAKANIRRQADTMQVQDTLYRQFQAELGPDFLKMAGPAAALKYSGYEIVPFSAADVCGHIMRHGPTSLTIGSKFAMNQAETATVLQSAEREMIAGFRDSLVTKGAVERHAFSRTYAQPVGTDALVDLKGRPSDRIFELVRDSGDARAAVRVKTVLAKPEEIPATNQLTFVGGPYGPTKKAGFYTAFPGNAGQPFSDTEYWKTHGFKATPAEVRATLAEMKANTGTIAPAIAAPAAVRTMIAEGERQLARFEQPPVSGWKAALRGLISRGTAADGFKVGGP